MTNDVPGFWMNETSGVLRPAIEAYLRHEPMTPEQIAAMRAYLRQWIAAPVWRGPVANALQTSVDHLHTRADLDNWIDQATEDGMDPL